MICAARNCGNEFEPNSPRQKFCCAACCGRASYERSEKRRESSRRRSHAWYSDKENQVTKEAARRARRRSSKTGIGEWELEAPKLDYIPGAFMPIALSNGQRFEHWQISALHGMLTRITGPHAPNNPVFSLLPISGFGAGWAAYLRDLEFARTVACKGHQVECNGQEIELILGWLVRVRAPVVKKGLWRMQVTAITPVHCRSTGGAVHYTEPTANNIKGTLEAFTARRLGLNPEKRDVQVSLLDSSAFPDRLHLSGNGSKLGDVSGWSGSVRIECNAYARFLLECAALGIGLGGRTAFGFGRIKVEALCNQHD